MYKLEYLPAARQDLIEIVRYISRELKNPSAAERLAVKLTDATERAAEFPYGCPAYISLRPLQHEYRKLTVENYLIFYWVDETEQVVTIARVIYGRRNYGRMLKRPDE